MLPPSTALSKDRRQPTSPKFEHRHLAAIAAILQDCAGLKADEIPYRFASQLSKTNPKFDRARCHSYKLKDLKPLAFDLTDLIL